MGISKEKKSVYDKERYQKNRERNCADSVTYYKGNREARKRYAREYREKNPEKVRLANKCWIENNPEKHLLWVQQYKIRNGDRIRKNKTEYSRRWRINIKNKLNNNISTAMRNSLRGIKCGHYWESIVGYDLQELMTHIESQFGGGMSWNNYGRNGWHIDHIVPRSWFSFQSLDDPEFKKCWALENLQPMWEKHNLSKGNRYAG